MSSWNAPEEHGGQEIDPGPVAEELGPEAAAEDIQNTAEFDALPVLAREQVLTPTYYRAAGAQLARSAMQA